MGIRLNQIICLETVSALQDTCDGIIQQHYPLNSSTSQHNKLSLILPVSLLVLLNPSVFDAGCLTEVLDMSHQDFRSNEQICGGVVLVGAWCFDP